MADTSTTLMNRAIDRFVFMYGRALSNESVMSKLCRGISTKTGSILSLILPLLCSVPMAIGNVLQAHVLHTSTHIATCIVQHTYGILINILIFFYGLPLLLSFLLYIILIYFICVNRKRSQRTMQRTVKMLSTKQRSIVNAQKIAELREFKRNKVYLFNSPHLVRQQRDGRWNLFRNTRTSHDSQNSHSRNTSKPKRTSILLKPATLTRPFGRTNCELIPAPRQIVYTNNTRANANAKLTVVLLVSLLVCYILCWTPYNIYTWHHAYQLTQKSLNQNSPPSSTLPISNSQFFSSVISKLHTELRQFILTNYSLYLLSTVSTCFNFIFYFSLNKQARREFSQMVKCSCTCKFL